MLLERLRLEAKSELEKLWAENLIPFELEARKVDYLGFGEYIIRFYDSRLRSVDVSWQEGDSFADLVRVAVLARVERIAAHAKGRKVKKMHGRHAA